MSTQNQIISTKFTINTLNKKIQIAQKWGGSELLIRGLKKELKTQKECLEYLNSLIPVPEFRFELENNFSDLNLNAIFATI